LGLTAEGVRELVGVSSLTQEHGEALPVVVLKILDLLRRRLGLGVVEAEGLHVVLTLRLHEADAQRVFSADELLGALLDAGDVLDAQQVAVDADAQEQARSGHEQAPVHIHFLASSLVGTWMRVQ
jgi:hypothetical protein